MTERERTAAVSEDACVRSNGGLLCEVHGRQLWPSLADRCNGWMTEREGTAAMSEEGLRAALRTLFSEVGDVDEEPETIYAGSVEECVSAIFAICRKAAPPAPLGWPTLANVIREVDGNHDLGAGELAGRILEHPSVKGRRL